MSKFEVGDKVVRKACSPSEHFGKNNYYVVMSLAAEGLRIGLCDDDGDSLFWDSSNFELYKPEENEPVIEISHLKEVIESLMETYQSKEKTLDYFGAYIAGYERGCNK